MLAEPYVMVGVNLFAADTDAAAQRLFTTLQQQFLNLIRGTPTELPAPLDSMQGRWTIPERAHVERMTRVSAVGAPDTIREQLQEIVTATGADELILTAQIYDHDARLRSFELGAQVFATV